MEGNSGYKLVQQGHKILKEIGVQEPLVILQGETKESAIFRVWLVSQELLDLELRPRVLRWDGNLKRRDLVNGSEVTGHPALTSDSRSSLGNLVSSTKSRLL